MSKQSQCYRKDSLQCHNCKKHSTSVEPVTKNAWNSKTIHSAMAHMCLLGNFKVAHTGWCKSHEFKTITL